MARRVAERTSGSPVGEDRICLGRVCHRAVEQDRLRIVLVQDAGVVLQAGAPSRQGQHQDDLLILERAVRPEKKPLPIAGPPSKNLKRLNVSWLLPNT